MSDMDWANISDATPSLSWPPQPSHNITNDEIERLRAELAAAIKQRDGYRSALERIANEDYRGNRSNESQIAFDALAAADAARAAMRKVVQNAE